MLYTAQQIAEQLNRPATTIRHWSKIYSDFLPGKKTKRYKEYTETAIGVFKKIAELSNNGLFKDQVVEKLQQEFGVQQDADVVDEKPKGDMVLAKDFQPVFNFFMQLNEKQEQRHNETLTLMQQQISQTQELISILLKQKTEVATTPTTKEKIVSHVTESSKKKVVKKPTKQVVKKVVEKKKLPPRGKGGKFVPKKQSFWNKLGF